MGLSSSVFTEEELLMYEELTFLNRAEILHAYKRFVELCPNNCDPKTSKVAIAKVAKCLSSLKENPFAVQICNVFSSSEDGHLTFVDFLDMVSVFNPKCEKSIKIHWGFQIFDLNQDGYLCADDIERVLALLTNRRIPNRISMAIINEIFKKTEVQGNRLLSYNEFERRLFKSDSFHKKFTFHLE